MNAAIEAQDSPATNCPPALPCSAPQHPKRGRARLMVVARFVGLVVLSQSLLLSFLVVGWLSRWMQRAVYRAWWRASGHACATSFEALAAEVADLEPQRAPPALVFFRRNGGRLSFFAPAFANARAGVQMAFNTWVLTLPGCVVMLFSWGYGWNNSFTKGYELAPIGPGTGVLGLAMFIAGMLYVPLAQAHQAATGSWRAFYQWRTVWTIIRHRWAACLGLAVLYASLSLPIQWMRIAPYYFPQMQKHTTEQLTALTPREVEGRLSAHFLGASVLVCGALLLVRLAAARIYASGALAALRATDLQPHALTPVQWKVLDRLGHLQTTPPKPTHPLLAVSGRTMSLLGRMVSRVAIVVVWFGFVAQIYIAQFLNYIPLLGWVNQPLVQLPWIKYIPGKVNGEMLGLILVALLGASVLLARAAIRRFALRRSAY